MADHSRNILIYALQMLFASVTTVAQVTQSQAGTSVGSVVLHVVDSYGGSISVSEVTKLTLLNTKGEDVSPRRFDGMLRDLPYGDYSVRVEIPGFKYWTRKVWVAKPMTWVTVGMETGSIEGNSVCTLSGSLTGSREASASIWIRLIQLYSNNIIEANVDARGFFHVEGVPCGKYIVAVMSDVNPIRLITVALRRTMEPLSIALDDAQPPR